MTRSRGRVKPEGVKVDCPHVRANHQHGTYGAYSTDRCRCLPCRAANAAYNREYRARTAAMVSRVGTVRRLEALAAAGWTGAELGKRLHINGSGVWLLRTRSTDLIHRDIAAGVTALYTSLAHATPPASKGTAYAANRAVQHGWAEPWRWDGINMDDPAAEPLPLPTSGVDEVVVERLALGWTVPATRAEIEAARLILETRGLSASEIARRLRITRRTVERHRGKAAA